MRNKSKKNLKVIYASYRIFVTASMSLIFLSYFQQLDEISGKAGRPQHREYAYFDEAFEIVAVAFAARENETICQNKYDTSECIPKTILRLDLVDGYCTQLNQIHSSMNSN